MRFKVVKYVFILFLFFSCKEEESYEEIDIVVHAVSGLYNPQSFHVDNSKEAMHYALKFEELDGIEVDVQYSNEGSLWMFHDELLDERTNETGRICEKTDAILNQVSYTDIDGTPVARLSSVDWSLNSNPKKIYVDLKNLNSCVGDEYLPTQFITELNKISQHDGISVFPIVNDTSFAHAVHNAGFNVFSDAFSYDEAKEKLASFYYGVFIRNADVSGSDVSNLQINNKKVILFDMFSMKGVREGLEKYPTAVLVEDFKSAILERN